MVTNNKKRKSKRNSTPPVAVAPYEDENDEEEDEDEEFTWPFWMAWKSLLVLPVSSPILNCACNSLATSLYVRNMHTVLTLS